MRATTTLAIPSIETYAVHETLAALERAARHANKALVMCAAPFIGLAFVVALPIAGLAVLAWMAARAFAAHHRRALRFARNVALFLAAPFIGLAYAMALPFVGAVLLAGVAVRAARRAA